MKLGFDRKALSVAVLFVLGVCMLIASSLQALSELRASVAEFDDAREVQMQTQRLHIALLELEAGRQRHLLGVQSGDAEPHRAALATLDAEVRRLASLASDHPEQAADLALLLPLVEGRRSEHERIIAAAAPPGPAAGDAGRAGMDDIRAVLARLDQTESVAQEARHAARAASIDRSRRYTLMLVGLTALLLGLLVTLVRRDKALRARLWKADVAARAELEQRVALRTGDLQEALQALALGKARLRAIFDTASDAILTVNAEHRIVEANPAAGRLFGLAVAGLVGSPLHSLIPPRFRDAHRHDMDAYGAGEEGTRRMGRSREVMALRACGEEFPIEAGISHFDVSGQRLYTVILRDITQRRQDEAALRDSRAKLAAALASMTDAVFISDAEGRFVEVNDAFVTFHRFSSREECRMTLAAYPAMLEVCLPDGSPAPAQQWAVARALRGERASNVEYALRRRDTGESWVGSYSFAPILSPDGQIIGTVVSGRDITDLKKAQAELAASHAELQRLITNQHQVQEDERKRIARELHDDLQQSLAAIRMDAVAVAERLARGRGGAQALLQRIDKLSAAAIASTRRIVSDLRPEMLEDLGLVPALQALCDQHAALTGAHCRLEVLPGAVDARIESSAVATGLYRIAQEALNNVAKHARATTVTLRLDRTEGGLVILRICDNGVGMAPRAQRPAASFGLKGMTERVRALGGQLRIDSTAGGGTTLEALVPVFGAPAGAAEADVLPWPGLEDTQADGWGRPLQGVIDALDGQVAVLDAQGHIRHVNRAWRQLAALNGDADLVSCGPGVNYVEVCRRSGASDPATAAILQGLEDVLAKRREAFMAEYPCDTPAGRQWFRMHAAPVAGGLVIVTHVDLTSRIAAADVTGASPPERAAG